MPDALVFTDGRGGGLLRRAPHAAGQRGIEPTRSAWANVAMGLGSVGLGIGATAVTLHSLSSTGTVPKATVVLGPFHASVMSSTTSISTAQVVLVVLIWVVIAVVNIAYARRRLGRS